ncbi:hypothetical protein HaLaN_33056 [Haematococcus lacustris]|uniref:Uncharacterized protein n=1 Tax=Haematococcus lacustris TaxID=44745 RepID=A0A6A0AP89_HAELA|nr:hypothetical protein HaLaN_33056 [Haematococcus lacustris]
MTSKILGSLDTIAGFYQLNCLQRGLPKMLELAVRSKMSSTTYGQMNNEQRAISKTALAVELVTSPDIHLKGDANMSPIAPCHVTHLQAQQQCH